MDEILYKVFVKLDEHNCITSVEGTAFHGEDELLEQGYVQIDEGSGNVYGHCQPLYLKEKYGKEMYDENMFPNFKLVENEVKEVEPTEKEEWFIKPQRIAQDKANQEAMLQDMMMKAQQVAFLVELPDEEAVKIHYCYPTWKSYVGKPLTKLNEQGKENRIEYDGKLWKVRNDIPVVLENQAPGIETAALYERIDVEHEGTLEDPIPYDQTMTVYKDKYYIENEKIYKCIRDSEQPLYATCESLVGNYFELV